MLTRRFHCAVQFCLPAQFLNAIKGKGRPPNHLWARKDKAKVPNADTKLSVCSPILLAGTLPSGHKGEGRPTHYPRKDKAKAPNAGTKLSLCSPILLAGTLPQGHKEKGRPTHYPRKDKAKAPNADTKLSVCSPILLAGTLLKAIKEKADQHIIPGPERTRQRPQTLTQSSHCAVQFACWHTSSRP